MPAYIRRVHDRGGVAAGAKSGDEKSTSLHIQGGGGKVPALSGPAGGGGASTPKGTPAPRDETHRIIVCCHVGRPGMTGTTAPPEEASDASDTVDILRRKVSRVRRRAAGGGDDGSTLLTSGHRGGTTRAGPFGTNAAATAEEK